ncbi:unnamed protein product [Lepidochelys olivacea]
MCTGAFREERQMRASIFLRQDTSLLLPCFNEPSKDCYTKPFVNASGRGKAFLCLIHRRNCSRRVHPCENMHLEKLPRSLQASVICQDATDKQFIYSLDKTLPRSWRTITFSEALSAYTAQCNKVLSECPFPNQTENMEF